MSFLKKIKNRLKAKESKIGKILKTWVAGILVLCTALGSANDYFVLIPELTEHVPVWIKTTVALSGLISFVAGKLTVHPDEQGNTNTDNQGGNIRTS